MNVYVKMSSTYVVELKLFCISFETDFLRNLQYQLSSMNLTFKCCVNEPAIAIFTSKHKGTRATIVSGTNSNTIQRLEESPIVVLRRVCSVACAITPVQTNKQTDVIEEISRK